MIRPMQVTQDQENNQDFIPDFLYHLCQDLIRLQTPLGNSRGLTGGTRHISFLALVIVVSSQQELLHAKFAEAVATLGLHRVDHHSKTYWALEQAD